jgi:putative Mg2+ transporter-C (MgtC) family protein
MRELAEQFASFDVRELFSTLVTLILALVVSLPVAWERESANRIAGLRTFPLVAVSSAAYVLVGRAAVGGPSGEKHAYILQGLMTGLGFLGAGAIIRSGRSVRGTATAAALWSTAAIGAAVAYRHLEIALVLSAFNLFGLRVLQPVKERVETHDRIAEADERRRDDDEPPSLS